MAMAREAIEERLKILAVDGQHANSLWGALQRGSPLAGSVFELMWKLMGRANPDQFREFGYWSETTSPFRRELIEVWRGSN